MVPLPVVIPLSGVSFETAVAAMAADPGVVAIDARGANDGRRRISIVASHPTSTFSFSGAFVTVDGHTVIDSPRTALDIFLTRAGNFSADSYLPFSGGAIGYIGFEGAQALNGFEPARGFSRIPQCSFGIYPIVLLFDRVEGSARIVAHADGAEEACREADRLRRRLERAAPWQPPAATGPGTDAGAIDGHAQQDVLRKLVDNARDWIRAERLSRVSLARHVRLPQGTVSAIDAFLMGISAGGMRALFVHEDAATIATSRQVLLETPHRGGVPATRVLFSLLPETTVTGMPLGPALSFLGMHEKTPRQLYGGAFGTIDAAGIHFNSVDSAEFHADGAVRLTAGADVTAESDPASVIGGIEATFANLTPSQTTL